METTLSSKGQIVLPKSARQKLGVRPGTKFACRVAGQSIVLTPTIVFRAKPRLVRDGATRLMITQGPVDAPVVTSGQVRAALADFP
jgi:AbrB family looped-hinge helix DNA binding protein